MPKLFEKGNPGKQKGQVNKVTQASKELFLSVMEGEVENIKTSLDIIRKKDPARYLEVLAKFYPYFMPKKLEIDVPNGFDIRFRDAE